MGRGPVYPGGRRRRSGEFPTEGEFRYFQGRNGARDIVVRATIPHGKHTRDIQIPIEPEMILKLADAIRCCPEHIGEVVPVGRNDDGSLRYERVEYVHLAHAVHHMDHPDIPRPCLPRSGKPVIDVATDEAPRLPPGAVIDVQAIDVPPQDADSPAFPATETVAFRCPRCGGDRFNSSVISHDPSEHTYRCKGSEGRSCSFQFTRDEAWHYMVLVTERRFASADDYVRAERWSGAAEEIDGAPAGDVDVLTDDPTMEHAQPAPQNRARLAREQAGISVEQAAKMLGMESAEILRIETYDSAFFDADPRHLAELYRVRLEWLTGDDDRYNYKAVDEMKGADNLTEHDRDVIAQFAASLPPRTKHAFGCACDDCEHARAEHGS